MKDVHNSSMLASERIESYRKRLWSLFAEMPNWPYLAMALKPNGESCSCGAPRASVKDGHITITGCSRVLTGTATGGPESHTHPGGEDLQIAID